MSSAHDGGGGGSDRYMYRTADDDVVVADEKTLEPVPSSPATANNEAVRDDRRASATTARIPGKVDDEPQLAVHDVETTQCPQQQQQQDGEHAKATLQEDLHAIRFTDQETREAAFEDANARGWRLLVVSGLIIVLLAVTMIVASFLIPASRPAVMWYQFCDSPGFAPCYGLSTGMSPQRPILTEPLDTDVDEGEPRMEQLLDWIKTLGYYAPVYNAVWRGSVLRVLPNLEQLTGETMPKTMDDIILFPLQHEPSSDLYVDVDTDRDAVVVTIVFWFMPQNNEMNAKYYTQDMDVLFPQLQQNFTTVNVTGASARRGSLTDDYLVDMRYSDRAAELSIEGLNSTAVVGRVRPELIVKLNPQQTSIALRAELVFKNNVCQKPNVTAQATTRQELNAGIQATDGRGRIKYTSCRIYGQESSVVAPVLFLVLSALKSVFLLFVFQRVMLWLITSFRARLTRTTFINRFGAAGILWASKTNTSRHVQRLHVFFGGQPADDVAGVNSDLMQFGADGPQPMVGLALTDLHLDNIDADAVFGALQSELFESDFPIPHAALQRAQLLGDAHRDTFPLSDDASRSIIAGLWLSTLTVNKVKSGSGGERRQLSRALRDAREAFHNAPEFPPYPAIHSILLAAGLPDVYAGELHRVVAEDLWAMSTRCYDLQIPLPRVFHRTTVLLYAVIYLSITDHHALRSMGLKKLALLALEARPALVERFAGAPVPEKLVAPAKAHQQLALRESLRRRVCEELAESAGLDPRAVQINDTPQGGASEGDAPKTTTTTVTEGDPLRIFGGPESSWGLKDFVDYFATIATAMPSARGCMSQKVQLAHHIVRGVYPNNFLVALGCCSTALVIVVSVVAAHETPLRQVRTVAFPFAFKWANSGVLVTNLLYSFRILQVGEQYGIPETEYQRPAVHTLYVVLTALGVVVSLPVAMFGLVIMLPFAVIVYSIVWGASAAFSVGLRAVLANRQRANPNDAQPAITRALVEVLAGTVFITLFVLCGLQIPLNVGFDFLIRLFDSGEWPDDPLFYLVRAVGAEYYGRRLSCSIERTAVSYVGLVDTLSFVVLP